MPCKVAITSHLDPMASQLVPCFCSDPHTPHSCSNQHNLSSSCSETPVAPRQHGTIGKASSDLYHWHVFLQPHPLILPWYLSSSLSGLELAPDNRDLTQGFWWAVSSAIRAISSWTSSCHLQQDFPILFPWNSTHNILSFYSIVFHCFVCPNNSSSLWHTTHLLTHLTFTMIPWSRNSWLQVPLAAAMPPAQFCFIPKPHRSSLLPPRLRPQTLHDAGFILSPVKRHFISCSIPLSKKCYNETGRARETERGTQG